MTGPPTVIVVYSISYSDGLLRELPYIRHFYERGLSQLARLTAPEAHVVLVTPEPVDRSILDYHYRDVLGFAASAERLARNRSLFLSPEPCENSSLADLVLSDDVLMSRLREERDAAGTTLLVNFAASASVERLGAALGIPVEEGPYALAMYWGSKSGSKAAFAKAGVPAPLSYLEVVRSPDEVAAAVGDLADGSGTTSVMVKLDHAEWGSGIGNAVFDAQRLRLTGSLRESAVQILQPWNDFVEEIISGGAIVEEYINAVSCSPSGQGYIAPDGEVEVTSTHDQITTRDEYVGCIYPAMQEWRAGVRRAVGKVGAVLSADGVRGTFGVDFIAGADRGLLATEINVRKVGPSHVYDYVRSAGAPERWARRGEEVACHYVHRRVNRPDALMGTSPSALIERLRHEGLLFDHRVGTGVLLHILGALQPYGYVETTSIGASRADAEELDTLTQAVLCPRDRPAVRETAPH